MCATAEASPVDMRFADFPGPAHHPGPRDGCLYARVLMTPGIAVNRSEQPAPDKTEQHWFVWHGDIDVHCLAARRT